MPGWPEAHLVPQTPAFAAASLHEILGLYRANYVIVSTPYGSYAANGLMAGAQPEIRVVAVFQTGAIYAPTARPPGPS